MDFKPKEELLTIRAAAARTGLPEAEIRRAMVNGRLPFVRRRLRYWIKPEDLPRIQGQVLPPVAVFRGQALHAGALKPAYMGHPEF